MEETGRYMEGAFYVISPYEDSNYNQAVMEHLYRSTSDGFVCMQIYKPAPCISLGRNLEYPDKTSYDVNRRLCGGDEIRFRSSCVVISFISSRKDCDIRKQSAVVSLALKSLGVPCIRNSKNEIYLENGREACTNLYDISGDICRQMLIINVSTMSNANANLPSAISRYGLDEYVLIEAIEASFKSLYKANKKINPDSLDKKKLNDFYKFFCSDNWIYNKKSDSPYENFSWGKLCIDIEQKDAIIEDVHLYSNGSAAELLSAIPTSLIGCPYLITAIKNRVLVLPHAEKNLSILRDVLRVFEQILSKPV